MASIRADRRPESTLVVCANPALEVTYFLENLDPTSEVLTAEAVRCEADGKAVNVARALIAFGHRVTLVLPLGGHIGDGVASRLPASAICDVIPSAHETRISTVLVEGSTGRATIIRWSGESADPDLGACLLQHVQDHLPTTKLLVLSGSLPPELPPDIYARLCELATSTQVRTLVDCGGLPLAKALETKPFLVKVNRAEAGSVLGREVAPGNALSAVDELCARGAQHAIITMGGDGVVARCEGQQFRATVGLQPVVNSAGAGDAYLAGTVHAILNERSWNDAIRLGCAAGIAAVKSVSSVAIDLADLVSSESAVTVTRVS